MFESFTINFNYSPNKGTQNKKIIRETKKITPNHYILAYWNDKSDDPGYHERIEVGMQRLVYPAKFSFEYIEDIFIELSQNKDQYRWYDEMLNEIYQEYFGIFHRLGIIKV
ncbi:MAG: hypothetical protein HeimC2_40360 [Candidatus Heimdallarchaeota archaeon LC_2]|nr:MAG: hypothetical protein HeimC2_40360 [Candidatus Heimdallarchaeota archaeon LC_2]